MNAVLISPVVPASLSSAAQYAQLGPARSQPCINQQQKRVHCYEK